MHILYRASRIFILLLLVGVWTSALFTTPQVAHAQSGSFRGHIVEAGETMASIAAHHGISVADLARENQISEDAQLVPGQLLRIHNWDAPPASPDATGAEPSAPASSPSASSPAPDPQWLEQLGGEKWIDIDLTTQTLTAYQGDVAVRTFIISSGGTGHETVTGSFRIWAKVSIQDMSGGSRAAGTYYYVPDVPWVQYFYADYSIHGADWHNDFGYPISHGCVNMRVDEARWLFEWAEPKLDATTDQNGTWVFPGSEGTRVEVHY